MKRFVYSVLVIMFWIIFGLVGCDADAADSEESSVQPAAVPNAGSYYTIRFDNANGTGETTDDQVKVKTRYEIPECMFTPKKEASFLKWSDQRDGFGNSYDAGDKIKDPVGKGEVYTLYAIWDKTYYKVKYNANGGSGTMADSEFQVGRLATLPNCGFTNTGMRLRCWTTKEDGTGSSYRDRSEFIPSVRANDVVNLYAQWINENDYLINYYNVMNADNSANPDVFSKTTAFSLHDITRKGYTFLGWYDAETDGTQVTGWSANAKTDDVELWARWSVKTYSVALNLQGGSNGDTSVAAEYDKVLPDVDVPTKEGFSFGGYWTESNGAGDQYIDAEGHGSKIWNIDNTATLYAKWTGFPYSIKFNANGGSGNMDNQLMVYGESKALTPCAFTTPLKEFVGWSQNEGSSAADYQDGEVVCNLASVENEIVELYAVWDDVTIRYTFTPNGGKWGDSTEDIIAEGKYNTNVNVPSNPTRLGYTFSGWDYEVPTKYGEVNRTFTAQWTAYTYTIKFNSNGGSGSMSNLNMTYDTPAALPANKFTKSGLVFRWWNTKPDGTGTTYKEGKTVLNLTNENGATVILYARWCKMPVGSIVYSDGTYTASDVYNSAKTPIGVVFFSDETETKVVHLQQKNNVWCLETAQGYNIKFATNDTVGSGNWQIICNGVTDENTSGNYPAFEYVNTLGSGWYMPASREISTIISNRDTINQAITTLKNAGVTATEVGTYYWTSCNNEYQTKEAIYYYRSVSGLCQAGKEKSKWETVRAVKVF